MNVMTNNDEFQDDIEMEQVDEDGDELTTYDKTKQLREKLKACEAESKEHLDGWQRAKADMVNMRQSHLDDVQRAEERGAEKLIKTIAPVLDSFESAMQGDAWENVDSTWRSGVEGIHTQFMKALQANGLSVIDPTCEAFNPHEHESVSVESVDDEALDQTVTKTFQKGLKLGERVVRPAKVVVGEYQQ